MLTMREPLQSNQVNTTEYILTYQNWTKLVDLIVCSHLQYIVQLLLHMLHSGWWCLLCFT